MKPKFYVYALLDSRRPGEFRYENIDFEFSFEPFYIGKGSGYRDTTHLTPSEIEKTHNTIKSAKVRKILSVGLQVEIVRIAHFTDERLALDYEKVCVESIGTLIGRTGILANLAPGGGGLSSGINHPNFGVTWSEEVKSKMSVTTKKNLTPEALAILKLGRECSPSDETRARMSAAGKGKVRSPEHSKNISLAKKNPSQEQRNLAVRAQSKITEQEAKEIMELVISGRFTRRECAELYNTSRDNIDPMMVGQRWRYLTPFREALLEKYGG